MEHPGRPAWPARIAMAAMALLALCLLLAGCDAHGGTSARTPTAARTPGGSGGAPAPGPAADAYGRRADALLADMTLDQELGQLFVVEYLYTDANHADLPAMIGRMGAGGVILYHALNIATVPQTRQLTAAMQAQAAITLLIGADEEGGGDDQIDHLFGAHPTNLQLGASGDPRAAAQAATRIAGELAQLGMNADFAPVVDVMAPGRVWTRSFGRDPDLVARMGAAQVDAFQSSGIMACAKHFPGLGAATSNPHDGLPVIANSRDYIERVDLAPYRALIAHHPAMVMTTDLLMPAFDGDMPAELSPAIVTGILRREIGYDGVVVTDALYMGGITQRFSMPEAGVLSILAGNDMLEGPWDAPHMQRMIDALRAAVQSGRLPRARVDESVRRILLMKARYGLLPPPHHPGGRGPLPAGAAGAWLPALPMLLPPAPRRRAA